jgi:hypothetical protein
MPIGFWTLKKPAPLIAILVATVVGDRALFGDRGLSMSRDAAGHLLVGALSWE